MTIESTPSCIFCWDVLYNGISCNNCNFAYNSYNTLEEIQVIDKKKYIYINNVKNKIRLKQIFEELANEIKSNIKTDDYKIYIMLYNTKHSSIHLSIKSLNYLFQLYDISTNINLVSNEVSNEVLNGSNFYSLGNEVLNGTNFYLLGPLSNDYILNYETNFIDFLLES